MSETRGTKGQKKTYTFTSPQDARADFEKRISQKLANGYDDAPAGAKAAQLQGRPAWYVKLAKQGTDQFGGTPPGVGEKQWPRCKGCGEPMSFVLLLEKHPTRLPLDKHQAVALFTCSSETSDGPCQSWDPAAGGNAVLLLGKKELARKPLAKALGRKSVVIKGRKLAYTEKFEPDPEVEDVDQSKTHVNKVGGYPVWLQADETPSCKKCRKRLRFVAEIHAGIDRNLTFGDAGVGYLFVCPSEHEGRFLWQCT